MFFHTLSSTGHARPWRPQMVQPRTVCGCTNRVGDLWIPSSRDREGEKVAALSTGSETTAEQVVRVVVSGAASDRDELCAALAARVGGSSDP